jgi:methylated-DNA-[protein]-cysteine S-methyltransferase
MSLPPPELLEGEAAALAARTAARAADDGLAEVAYATVDSPCGRLVTITTPRGLARIAYELEDGGLDEILDDVALRLSPAIVEAPARLDAVRRELDEYFAGTRREFDLPLDWTLMSKFGRAVMQATARVGFGSTATYGEVAAQAGNAKASRAAGRALGANPIPIVLPCHRIVGASGKLTGYAGGLHRKEALLALESARA